MRACSRFAVRVAVVVLIAASMGACRSDEVTPDVFVDESHCARDPGAAPFGTCPGGTDAGGQ